MVSTIIKNELYSESGIESEDIKLNSNNENNKVKKKSWLERLLN